MPITTAEELAHRCEELALVSQHDLHEAYSELGGRNVPVDDLGKMLVRRELLTGYQLERLLKGERTGYFFGRTKILYQIGAGAFARVYRAIDTSDGSIHAVKVLRSRYSSDPVKCKEFHREGEMGRLLRHPNIVAIEDVGQQEGASYITMEFVEGQTLRELVRIRGAIDVPRGVDLVRQLAAGLEYAHRRGVTHRDLKASNVIVSSTGQAKVVDFGLAGIDADSGDRALGKVEHQRTVDYAALEKACGVRDDPVRCDIYFFGTIAYLVFSGASALGESRDRSVRSDPRRFSAVVPLATRCPDLPRDVADVVGRMLHLDPLERWQTMTELLRAIEQLAARHPFQQGGVAAAAPGAATASPSAANGHAAPQAAAPTRGKLMLVESSQSTLDKLRKFFTGLGFRVLETNSPQRALARFSSTPLPADGLVISAAHLGEDALQAFNALSKDPFLAAVPAILLLGRDQDALGEKAACGARRIVVKTPIDPKALDAQLATLLSKGGA
jgi:serine/threonine-protein kinase